MPIFILRVQLTNGTVPRYTLLRDRLLNIGFTKRIKSREGIEYRLPNGNYLIEGNLDLDKVMQAARAVVATLDANPQILLTQTNKGDSTWYGLEKC